MGGVRMEKRSISSEMTSRAARMRGRHRRSSRAASFAAALAVAIAALTGGSPFAAAQSAEDPSDVVLVFDVSDSILNAKDGTNLEFASALDAIADRAVVIADDLAVGNATISFVVFARDALPYPAGCQGLELHENPAAVTQFEACLRETAAEYRAGVNAPVKQKISVTATDHVAALDAAAKLLPEHSTRAAVIFFTDGENNPPGTSRDGENVVAAVTPAYAGRTPLAILPVGLGARASAFEADLKALYQAFLRDMEPCAGRTTFAWPQVVFPSGAAAGGAVALALQEVTCSFTVAPPTAPPSAIPALDAPLGVQVLAGNASLTIQWLPAAGGNVADYVVHCRPSSGGDWIESTEGVSTDTKTVIDGLQPGVAYDCEVAASDGTTIGPYAKAPASTVVLGIPGAPGQPRVEPLDAAVRVSVDPVAGGAPVEQYVYQCTGASGHTSGISGPDPNEVVSGLTNGESFQCVAYTENRIGRSAASPASAAFVPCSGIFACNPLAIYVAAGGGILAILVAFLVASRLYARRNRVWVTAQVDGGANRPLGWGPRLGIGLEADEDGWFAAPRPRKRAQIHARYLGNNRFLVESAAGTRDVHQGDPASVREEGGEPHQLILRLYRRRLGEEAPHRPAPAPAPRASDAGADAIVARLEGGEAPEPPKDEGPFIG
jgi:Fibronectin type III domain